MINDPRRALPAVGTILERLPLVREIAGSLLIVGRKPDRTPELPSARSVP